MVLLLVLAACPTVDTELAGGRWTQETEAAFRAELNVETSRIEHCLAGARMRLVWQGDEPVGVSVIWQTGETERQLRRSFDPRSVPADGLMLALAAVAGELLREAWHEPVVEAASPETPEPVRSAAMFVRLGGAVYGSGSTFAGGAIAVRFALPMRLELDISAGGRGALSRSSAAGSVSLASVTGALALAVRALELGAFVVLPLVQAEAGWVWALPASTSSTVRVQQGGAVLVTARAGVELAFRPGSVWWSLALTAGAPLRGAAFTDGTSTVTGVAGFEGGLTLSVGPAW